MKVRRQGRFVVVGVDAASGHTASLLLAARKGHDLVYVGRVEWGVTRTTAERIVERCAPRGAPACDRAERSRGVVWLDLARRRRAEPKGLDSGD